MRTQLILVYSFNTLSVVILLTSSNVKSYISLINLAISRIWLGLFCFPLYGTGVKYGESVSKTIFSNGLSFNTFNKDNKYNLNEPIHLFDRIEVK